MQNETSTVNYPRRNGRLCYWLPDLGVRGDIMKILVACEESQAVTIAFRELGHEAYSCDIKPCSGGHPEWHIQGDVTPLLSEQWDMMIAHPPCTYLTVSNSHMKRGCTKYTAEEAVELRRQAVDFFMLFVNAKIEKKAIENPIGVMSTYYRKPKEPHGQIIRPFQFGENATKATCLWLFNLPPLRPTNVIEPEKYTSKTGKVYDKWWFESSLIRNLEERAKFRSQTFPGIARAMAEQWGGNA